MSFASMCLPVLLVATMTGACHNLPAMAYVGQRAYMLQQRMECRGLKVYDIDNVQNIEQCKEACREFDCAAVNLFQLGEFAFKCEILSAVYGINPATGAACYYATDVMGGGGGMFGGFGGYGRRR